jgi:hypothetical protein
MHRVIGKKLIWKRVDANGDFIGQAHVCGYLMLLFGLVRSA